MTKTDIDSVADRVLRDRLAGFGYRGAIVVFERDQEGEEAIGVTAKIGVAPDRIAQLPLLEIAGAMREAFLSEGEQRFPYVSYDYPAETSPNEAT